MKKIYFLLITMCLLLACEDKKSSKEPIVKKKKAVTTPISKKTEKVKQKDTLESTIITNDNVLDYMITYGAKNKERKVRITTDFGTIDIELFNETPYHRANFIMLTKRKYFDGTQFHRIVKNFIIQGGNSDGWKIANRRREIGNYLLPPDTKKGFKHHRGIVSMPSSDIERAYKYASPYEFFIVQKPGGTHHLNGAYTAFGKVTAGMDVVDIISNQKADKGEWPKHNIMIRKVEVID